MAGFLRFSLCAAPHGGALDELLVDYEELEERWWLRAGAPAHGAELINWYADRIEELELLDAPESSNP